MKIAAAEAKNRFAALAREAESGERILIARNGDPIAELGPYKAGLGSHQEGGIDWEAMRGSRKSGVSPRSWRRYRTISTIRYPRIF